MMNDQYDWVRHHILHILLEYFCFKTINNVISLITEQYKHPLHCYLFYQNL